MFRSINSFEYYIAKIFSFNLIKDNVKAKVLERSDLHVLFWHLGSLKNVLNRTADHFKDYNVKFKYYTGLPSFLSLTALF